MSGIPMQIKVHWADKFSTYALEELHNVWLYLQNSNNKFNNKNENDTKFARNTEMNDLT